MMNDTNDLSIDERTYWINRLSGDFNMSFLPYDRPASNPNFEYETADFIITDDLTALIKKISNNSDYNIFLIALSVLKMLCFKYTGLQDIHSIIPIFKQEKDGQFINNKLIIREAINGECTFKELLFKIRQTVSDANNNQNYSIENILYNLGLSESSKNPFTDFGIILSNIHRTDELNSSKLNIVFILSNEENKIHCQIKYNRNVYFKNSIERYFRQYQLLFELLLKNPETSVDKLPLLSRKEEELIIKTFNNTEHDIPQISVIELFENQVSRNPDKIALVCNNHRITYKKLGTLVDSYSRFLINKCCSGSVVALLFDQSIDTIVAMLSVIKVKAAFIPLDVNLPSDRIDFILKDCNADIILVKREYIDKVKSSTNKIVFEEINVESHKGHEQNSYSQIEQPVYIIYTSGTTGKPKGVIIKNSNLVNYCKWFTDYAKIKEQDKALLVTSYAFDLGYTSIFSSLLNGCELHICRPEELSSQSSFYDYLLKQNITYLKITPSLFNALIYKNIDSVLKLKCLRLLVFGGEEINVKDITMLKQLRSEIEIMNHYGPTETTIGSIAYLIPDKVFDSFVERPVIGKPIYNTNILILDKNREIVPVGMTGELCISGKGVGIGYLNNPELTHEKFQYSKIHQNKLVYHSGDIARWDENGNIEFIGRGDKQIKIRGYRVELDEITNVLSKNPVVRKAFVKVVKKENKDNSLALYVELNKNSLSVQDIKSYLRSKLPEYFIPQIIHILDEMPLNKNGKIDTKRLPELELSGYSDDHIVLPRNETEKLLHSIWLEELKINKLSIDDNFFNIGGDSIISIRLVSIINKNFDIQLKIADLYENDSIEKIAKKISELINEKKEKVTLSKQVYDDFDDLYNSIINEQPAN